MKQFLPVTGGHDLRLDDFKVMQQGYIEAFQAILTSLALDPSTLIPKTNAILSGIIPTLASFGHTNYSNGWIAFQPSGGKMEIFKVIGATILNVGSNPFFKIINNIITPESPVPYEDGSMQNVHFDKVMQIIHDPGILVPGVDGILYYDISLNRINILQDIYTNVQDKLAARGIISTTGLGTIDTTTSNPDHVIRDLGNLINNILIDKDNAASVIDTILPYSLGNPNFNNILHTFSFLHKLNIADKNNATGIMATIPGGIALGGGRDHVLYNIANILSILYLRTIPDNDLDYTIFTTYANDAALNAAGLYNDAVAFVGKLDSKKRFYLNGQLIVNPISTWTTLPGDGYPFLLGTLAPGYRPKHTRPVQFLCPVYNDAISVTYSYVIIQIIDELSTNAGQISIISGPSTGAIFFSEAIANLYIVFDNISYFVA